jgi:hypothetical protein
VAVETLPAGEVQFVVGYRCPYVRVLVKVVAEKPSVAVQ